MGVDSGLLEKLTGAKVKDEYDGVFAEAEVRMFGIGGAKKEAILKEIDAEQPVCGKIWSRGDLAYHCKDCEMDPTCAICVDCWKGSDHEGHDYFITHTAGGCCDCGDITAWKRKGWCSTHAAADDKAKENAEMKVDPEVVSQCETVYATVIGHLKTLTEDLKAVVDASSCEHGSPQRPSPDITDEETNKVVKQIQFVLAWLYDQSEPSCFRALVAQSFATNGRSEASCLNTIMMHHDYFPEDLGKLFHTMYFRLIAYVDFKRAFMHCFIRHYPKMLLNVDDDDTQDESALESSLVEFSVQLFTVSPLTEELVHQEEGLLETLVKTATSLFTQATMMTGRINCNHKIVEKRMHWRVMTDLYYVLAHKSVASYVLAAKPKLLEKWFELFTMAQGINPMKRIPEGQDHTPFDSLDWSHAFHLENSLMDTVQVILEGLDDKEGVKPDPLKALTPIIHGCVNFLLNDFSWLGLQSTQATFGYDEKFESHLAKTSYHVPVHRLLSFCLSELARLVEDVDISAIIDLPKKPPLAIDVISDPLMRIQIATSEARANYWVRNGRDIHYTGTLYYNHLCTEYALDRDIALLQMTTLLQGRRLFITKAIGRWGLKNYFRLGEPETAPVSEDRIAVAEDFLCLLIAIGNERGKVAAVSKRETLRRDLIHRLACEDHSHSELCKFIAKAQSDSKLFDEVLESVATPQGEGKFSMKDECWEEFDPCFFHLQVRPNDVHAAEERYCKRPGAKKGSKIKPQTRLSKWPFYPAFKRLDQFLSTDLIHKLLFSVIYRSINSKAGHSVSEKVVQRSLQLLRLCIDASDFYDPDAQDTNECPDVDVGFEWPKECNIMETIIHPVKVGDAKEVTIVELLEDMKEDEEMGEMESLIDSILDLLVRKDMGKGRIQLREKRAVSEERPVTPAMTLAEQNKKRQEQILAQFVAAQNSFMEAHGEHRSSDSEDDTMTEAEESSPASSKRKGKDKSEPCVVCQSQASGKSLSMVAYAQESNLIHMPTPMQLEDPMECVDQPSPNLNIQFCGHYIHDECFLSYFESLRAAQAHQVAYSGEDFIHLDAGEFLCPLCRGLSNAVVPVLIGEDKDDAVSMDPLSPLQVVEKLKGYAATGVVTQEEPDEATIERRKLAEKLASTLESFQGKPHLEDVEEPVEAAVSLMAALAYNAACIEIDVSLHFDGGQHLRSSTLQTLVGLRTLARVCKSQVEATSNKFAFGRCYVGTLLKIITRDDKRSLLTYDVFRVFVEFCVFAPPALVAETGRTVGFMLYVACLVQMVARQYNLLHDGHNEAGFKSVVDEVLTNIARGSVDEPLDSQIDIEEVVDSATCFLRRCVLFLHAYEPSWLDLETYHNGKLPRDTMIWMNGDELMDILRFPKLSDISAEEVAHLKETLDPGYCPPDEMFVLESAEKRLVKLPKLFQELIEGYSKEKCRECDEIPVDPAVCLRCGHLCCAGSKCCKVDNEGECTQHSSSCGRGRGIFLFVKKSNVLFIGNERTSFWKSPYVDRYGEEDWHFKRGRPLSLSESRYEDLRRLWLRHAIDVEVARTIMSSKRMIIPGYF